MIDPTKFALKWLDGIQVGLTIAMAIGCITLAGCGLLGSEPVKSAIDIARGPAIDVLIKVIADRYGSDTDKASAWCEELPAGFSSGIEELDDEERGVFVMCWAKAGD